MKKLVTVVVSTAMTGAIVLTVTPEAHAGTPIRSKALSTAAAQKDDPYKGGAAGPNAFDCSGLIRYPYKKHGKTLPHNAQAQYNKSTKISANKRAKGDLVFFGPSKSNIKHVGIYAGGGKIWNANSGAYRGKKVVLAPISEYAGHVYYGRING